MGSRSELRHWMTTTTPICGNPLDNEYADVVRRSGIDPMENPYEFFTAMMRGFDAVQAARSETNPRRQQPRARQEYALSLLRETGSMVDAADSMGISLGDFCRHLTFGKPTIIEMWHELRWLEIEAIMFDHGPMSIRALADEADISFTQARNLIDWYDLRNHWAWL